MTTHYKKFVRLIAKWPIDSTKGERDLGLFIRERVKAVFEADKKTFDTEFCNAQYESLNRLADNVHYNTHRRALRSSATGLNIDECNVILSDDILNYLKEEDKGFFRKIFKKKED